MDRVKLNRWLIAIVAAAMLTLVFMPEEQTISIKIDSEHPEADYTMENVIITQYDQSGNQNHQLFAQKLIHYNQTNEFKNQDNEIESNQKQTNNKTNLDSEVSILEQPKILYNTTQGQWELSAEIGRMTNSQSLLFLQDDVKLNEVLNKNGDSSQVLTKDLVIELNNKTANTDQNVTLKAENLVAHSRGMKIDIEKSKVYLLSNVRSQLTRIKN